MDATQKTTDNNLLIEKTTTRALMNYLERQLGDRAKIIKANTTDADLDWFNVGEYKALANTIGDRETCPPENAANEM